MDIEDVSKRPKGWPSQPGELFPTYHLLKDVGEFAGGTVQLIDSSQPLATEAIALRKNGKIRVLIANLTDKPKTVRFRGLGEPIAVLRLWEGGTKETMSEIPITLPPHGIARIDRVAD